MFKPPRDGLIRARSLGFELEPSADGTGAMPTLHGYAIRFGEWTRISSVLEGTFMERIAPGAAAKTLAENSRNVKVMFNHGKDPQIGEKLLGAPTLTEDNDGVTYSAQLFDTQYNRDLIPGLEAGLYGASFRFSVVKESVNQNPTRSASNPRGIPERTVEELQLTELGPVTWPAYAGATAEVRSLTGYYAVESLRSGGEFDLMFAEWVKNDPEYVRSLLKANELIEESSEDASDEAVIQTDQHSDTEPSEAHSVDASRDRDNVPLYGTKRTTADTKPEWFLGN